MKRERFSDEIRRAINDSGMSRYRIAKEINVAESTLSRFMSSERGLNVPVLDRLAALLGLHVTTRKGR